MPAGPSSSAIDRVRFTTPALAATKALCSRSGTSPATDAMLTIRPPPADRITGTTAWLVTKTPVRSTRTMRVPVVAAVLVDRAAVLDRVDAGVVHQDADRPQAVDDLTDGGSHGVDIGHVSRDGDGLSTGARQLVGSLPSNTGFNIDDGHGGVIGQ